MRFTPVRSLLATVLLLPLLAAPAAAQYAIGADNPAPAAPPPAAKPTQTEEVPVIAPRAVQPDYQTVDEYHKAEFTKLDAIYGKPPPPDVQGDSSFDAGGAMDGPNNRSSTRDAIRNAPSIRQTLKGQ
ncbi:hypothetical protein [Oleisolibacter albus]|uniref:hypothetical protein n=1 Tax=Oleisolibacter albus TaxID=2171757 RepID=UPI0012D76252|nr:hypothetical protein [Oleisolibacter albus]